MSAPPDGQTKAVVLAAGLGTRLRPLTDRLPKCLVPIGGRPLLGYWFDCFQRAGIEQVLVNTHHLPELVRDYLAAVELGGRARVREAYEPQLLGSAGTLTANADFIGPTDEALIVYADNLSNVDLTAFLAFHHSHDDDLTMLLYRTPFPERCGIAELDPAGRIVRFEEKPKIPKCDLANAGLYAVSAAAWREMIGMRRFDLAFDVLPAFVGRMRGWVWNGYHRDIGSPEALVAANRDVATWPAALAEERA